MHDGPSLLPVRFIAAVYCNSELTASQGGCSRESKAGNPGGARQLDLLNQYCRFDVYPAATIHVRDATTVSPHYLGHRRMPMELFRFTTVIAAVDSSSNLLAHGLCSERLLPRIRLERRQRPSTRGPQSASSRRTLRDRKAVIREASRGQAATYAHAIARRRISWRKPNAENRSMPALRIIKFCWSPRWAAEPYWSPTGTSPTTKQTGNSCSTCWRWTPCFQTTP